jgi:hypothetical protein
MKKTLCLSKEEMYLFNRIILSHLWLWTDRHTKLTNEYTPPITYKLRTAGFNSRAVHPFSDEEVKRIIALGRDPDFMMINETKNSWLTMALEVARLWAIDIPKEDRPLININDRRLLMGKHNYFSYLMGEKKKGISIYKEQKEIIQESSLTAVLWYNTTKKFICKGG